MNLETKSSGCLASYMKNIKAHMQNIQKHYNIFPLRIYPLQNQLHIWSLIDLDAICLLNLTEVWVALKDADADFTES